MEGGVLDILWSLVTALIGAYLLASGFEGFFFRWSLKWFERPLMILGAVMLIVPRYGHRFGRYRHHRGGVCHRVHV